MRSWLSAAALSSLLLLTGVAADDGTAQPGTHSPTTNRGLGRAVRLDDVGESWTQFNSAPVGGTRPTISAADVPRLALFWRIPLPEVADSTPLYVNDAVLANGSVRDLLIIETKAGRLIALNAKTGVEIWSTTPPEGPRWTTSSPAVDPNRLYVYGYALDGYIHKYALADGQEITGDGWPELVTLKGSVEKGSSAISIAKARNGATYLYMTTAAYPEPGDDGDYQGHLVTVDLATGRQTVFNAGCSDRTIHFVENGDASNDCGLTQGGIWGRAGAVYDPITDRVFVTVGNGTFDADRGGFNWGSSIVALRPDGTTDGGTPVDSYTPTNYALLNALDLDLSSASVAPLPMIPGKHLHHFAVQGGKDGFLRLVDLSDLSRQGGPRHLGGELDSVKIPQSGPIVTHPATWLDTSAHTDWIFVANFHGIAAFTLDTSGVEPELLQQWWRPESASSPVVVNNVLYYAGSAGMQAVNPTTGTVLWRDTNIANIHWQSPIVVNGTIYIADASGSIAAYSTLPPRR